MQYRARVCRQRRQRLNEGGLGLPDRAPSRRAARGKQAACSKPLDLVRESSVLRPGTGRGPKATVRALPRRAAAVEQAACSEPLDLVRESSVLRPGTGRGPVLGWMMKALQYFARWRSRSIQGRDFQVAEGHGAVVAL